jgi:transcription-repair coupling factor (superfamily II helicase)
VTLLDSAQVRLKRMYPAAHYRATTSTVQVPIPRGGGSKSSVGAPRIRDVELLQMVADLVTALQGKPQQEIGITKASPPPDDDADPEPGRGGVGQSARAMSREERQAR